MELVDRMLAGDRRALAQLITFVESGLPQTPEVIKEIYPHQGKAYTVGFTGPPGAGKSTVVDKLTTLLRRKGLSVGIIAVDPTSPFSGGAFLGDRIRMQQHYLDEGVFIRSMATRGSQGGLPSSVWRVIKLLDAFGKDFILVETVGVGQVEIDIAEATDTTVVILVPEAGDSIQTLKAGLFEIANILVVNKADREGASQMATALEAMLRLNHQQPDWKTPVIKTQAINNIGIDELLQKIEDHRRVLQGTGQFARLRLARRRAEFIQTMEAGLKVQIMEMLGQGRLKEYMERVEKGELDPYSASLEVLQEISHELDALKA